MASFEGEKGGAGCITRRCSRCRTRYASSVPSALRAPARLSLVVRAYEQSGDLLWKSSQPAGACVVWCGTKPAQNRPQRTTVTAEIVRLEVEARFTLQCWRTSRASDCCPEQLQRIRRSRTAETRSIGFSALTAERPCTGQVRGFRALSH